MGGNDRLASVSSVPGERMKCPAKVILILQLLNSYLERVRYGRHNDRNRSRSVSFSLT